LAINVDASGVCVFQHSLKKWLYTDREIFIRDLVSNSCDAINKLKILREQNNLSFSDDQLRIDIESDKHANKTLKVADVGYDSNLEREYRNNM